MRSIRIAMTPVLWFALAFTAIACGLTSSDPLNLESPRRGLKPFMGVPFGDSFDDVERRFPLGLAQTSPYGARAYKLENVNSASIDYQDVTYEFSDTAGMQMVFAHFMPSQTIDVYQELQKSLGAPSSANASSLEEAARADAMWHLPDGATALFSGPAHRLALVGKDGGSLKSDIRLRDAAP